MKSVEKAAGLLMQRYFTRASLIKRMLCIESFQ